MQSAKLLYLNFGMKHVHCLLALTVLFFSSCGIGGERIKGNGNIRTEERTVSSFDEIEVHGALAVYVTQGDFAPLKFEGDENLLQYVEVVEKGDKISIQPRGNYNLDFTDEMKVYVTAPEFRRIDVSGACKIIGESMIDNKRALALELSGASEMNLNIDAPEIEARLSGSSTLKARGETKEVILRLSGASNAKCFDLLSEEVSVDISGAGNAEVYASVAMNAEVSGAGNVKYKGKAKKVKHNVSGAGSVDKVD
jgi:hypothetical protein